MAATFLAFPHPVAGGVVDLGLLTGWLSPALLILCLEGASPRAAFVRALLLSWVAHAGILHWIYVVTVTYGHAPAAVGVVAPVVLALYIAPFSACFGALYRWCGLRGVGGPFVAALLWTALDHLRSFLMTGFPWATLGYSQHRNAALIGLAGLGGVYALSFATALGGAGLALLLRARARGLAPSRGAVLALGCVAALHAAGLLAGADDPRGAQLRIGVVQGNVAQGVKWDPQWMERTLVRYEALTRRAAQEGAVLVVWPETAVPGPLERDPGLAARVSRLAAEEGIALVVGGVGIELDPETGVRHYFDSAFLIGPDGQLLDRYDKTHLVPFGEFVPFRQLLGAFLGAVARGIASADVTPGERPRSLEVPLADGRQVRVGVAVCFELLFPDLVRRFAADGGQLLLAITNDAWYGRTGAPYQFLAITALRSAETGLWGARAANTGISGFIDRAGRVRAQTPLFEPAYRVANVRLHPDPAHATFYVRHGDWFAYGCWLGAAVAVLRAARSSARSSTLGRSPPPLALRKS